MPWKAQPGGSGIVAWVLSRPSIAKYLLTLVFGVLPKCTEAKLLLTQKALAACPWLKNQ